MSKPFLTAEWRYLAMLNFAIDPRLIEGLVPAGTEIDFHKGETFVSVVGFLFLKTRVRGFVVPFHQNFEEVNLRFYVRKWTPEGWRRGVTFVRELVPRSAIAFVARTFYGEPYTALPMRYSLAHDAEQLAVRFEWNRRGTWEALAMTATGEARDIVGETHQEFITEHYWGYTKRGAGTSEYAVEHPRWRFWPATSWKFEADVSSLYGQRFVETLSACPAAAFIAEGSAIKVRQGEPLR